MTTALIGNNGTLRAAARVGLVSKGGLAELRDELLRSGHDVVECSDWAQLVSSEGRDGFDLIVSDVEPDEGMRAPTAAILVTGGDSEHLHGRSLQTMLALAIELADRQREVDRLSQIVDGVRSGAAMIGNTPVVRRLQSAVSRAADCDATVLIEGPVGSGKSLAARMIHLKSRRGGSPVALLDCSSVSPEQLGQAIDQHARTTLILEDVDRLSSPAQSVLVKHLKERSTSRAPSMVRLIATTGAHVPELVAKGAFREDLYYRLHAFPIVVPGLRERVDDIFTLAQAALDRNSATTGRSAQAFTPTARMLLESMPWPGNVAQLELVVRRAQALAAGAAIDRDHLLIPASTPSAAPAPTSSGAVAQVADSAEITEEMIRPFEEEEQLLLGRALQATKGNVRRAAQLLGIGRATLYRKIQQYRLRLH